MRLGRFTPVAESFRPGFALGTKPIVVAERSLLRENVSAAVTCTVPGVKPRRTKAGMPLAPVVNDVTRRMDLHGC